MSWGLSCFLGSSWLGQISSFKVLFLKKIQEDQMAQKWKANTMYDFVTSWNVMDSKSTQSLQHYFICKLQIICWLIKYLKNSKIDDATSGTCCFSDTSKHLKISKPEIFDLPHSSFNIILKCDFLIRQLW